MSSSRHGSQPDRGGVKAGERIGAAPRTARVFREERKAEASVVLDRALKDTTQAQIAEDLGVGETIVAEWCKPEKARAIPVSDAAALPEAARLALARFILGDRFLIVVAPDATRADSIDAACEMMSKAAELSAHFAQSARDGAFDRGEGAVGHPLAMEVASLALGAAQTFALAMREGVVGLRNVRAINSR